MIFQCQCGSLHKVFITRDGDSLGTAVVEVPFACAVCRKPFMPVRRDQIYCSPACRSAGRQDKRDAHELRRAL